MNFADVHVGDELLVRVDAIDVIDNAPPPADEPDPDALLADMPAAAPDASERAARLGALVVQQHEDWQANRRMALDAAARGDPASARAAWSSAEALAIAWPCLLATA